MTRPFLAAVALINLGAGVAVLVMADTLKFLAVIPLSYAVVLTRLALKTGSPPGGIAAHGGLLCLSDFRESIAYLILTGCAILQLGHLRVKAAPGGDGNRAGAPRWRSRWAGWVGYTTGQFFT